jgi:D-alanine-D-alanine ligase
LRRRRWVTVAIPSIAVKRCADAFGCIGDAHLADNPYMPSTLNPARAVARREASRYHRSNRVAEFFSPPLRRKPLETMKKLRVLMLIDNACMPLESIEGVSKEEMSPWKTEYDVWATLSNLGHETLKVGVSGDLSPVRDAIGGFKPNIVFNLLEGFHDFHMYDHHVVSYLELMQQAYTGCNPRGMILARDKALTKKIMAYHRIRVPAFAVFPRARKVVRPRKLAFPLLVKSVNVEGSVGIAQASVVYDDEKLVERVKYIHEALGTFAIAEQYIEGRELYVGVTGNLRLQTFPIWELIFENATEGMHLIAGERAKWSSAYQRKWGIVTRAAQDLPPAVVREMPHLCKRIYRILGMTGYARMDFRMTPAGELYLLEANPNPQLGYGEDFAESAEAAGTNYEKLIQTILNLGLSYRPEALT